MKLAAALHAAGKPFSTPGLKQDIEFAKAGEVSLTLDAFVPEGEGPFCPPQDLVAHVKRRNELRGLGDLIGSHEISEANFAKLAAMSPITHVKAGLPPFLQIHGDADTTVAHEQSVMFEKAMKAASKTCETITVTGGGHGMGGWAKLNSDYATRMIDWLRVTLQK